MTPTPPATVTQQLVQFALALTIDNVPPAIRHKLKLHLIDAIGCGWAARQSAAAELARQAAGLLGGAGRCRVLGSDSGYAAPAAAFANAMIINGLDHDDGVEIDGKGLGHPGATLVAAAMAGLDQSPHPVPGSRLLVALAAGFEINNRLIHALQPSAERFEQVYGIAQHQAIGAAVVYGLIHEFDEPTLHHAIGLAATLANVPSLHKYNWRSRPLVTLKDGVASAAQAGVQAACLARAGFVGSRDVLDGPDGYWRMAGSDRFAPDRLTHALGNDWYVRYGSIKRYPACRWLACALECAEVIVTETGWQADEIARIDVQTFSRLVDDLMDQAPGNPNDAQFSLPFTLAAVVSRIPLGPRWYAAETMRDPGMQALIGKIRASVDPVIDQRMRGPDRQPGARVIVRHRDGRSATQERQMPLGSAARPMSETDIIEKARRNIAGEAPATNAWLDAILGHDRWDAAWSDSTWILPAQSN
ncbi:MmgE/PrpD family protein [Paraburkholderia caffeinilytica]|uniref:MmgE/PrpD family protein n=1 Tax=Paraburkholderia caffeinilytica TaxID=1761016 RepID=UPI003D9FCC74